MNWATVDPNIVMYVMLAMINLLTLYYTRRTEKNTNSMKDALVASSRNEAHAAGLEQGRQEGKTTAATLARGRLEATEEK